MSGPAGALPNVQRLTLAALDALAVDALVLWLPAGATPLAGVAGLVDWRLCGLLSRGLARGQLGDADGAHALLPLTPPLRARWALAAGLSPATWENVDALAGVLSAALAAAQAAGGRTLALAVPSLGPRFPASTQATLQRSFVAAYAQLARGPRDLLVTA